MGVNNWTPEQWRAYNKTTGDRHVNRQPPITAKQLLFDEDLPQERELARLERRRDVESWVKDYKRRELGYLAATTHWNFGDADHDD
jgi:hypothetical protein